METATLSWFEASAVWNHFRHRQSFWSAAQDYNVCSLLFCFVYKNAECVLCVCVCLISCTRFFGEYIHSTVLRCFCCCFSSMRARCDLNRIDDSRLGRWEKRMETLLFTLSVYLNLWSVTRFLFSSSSSLKWQLERSAEFRRLNASILCAKSTDRKTKRRRYT